VEICGSRGLLCLLLTLLVDQTLIPNREVVLKFNNKFATKIDFVVALKFQKG
jgi:hypothetical protein